MTLAVARRWLKVADPTALTAARALQDALGFAEVLRELARSEVLAFAWEESVDAAGLLERLARDTNLLQNPNKHHLEIAVGGDRIHPRGNVWVLAARDGDGTALGETLGRRRLLPGSAPRTARGTLWELLLDGSLEERLARAREMAVTESRRRGLLSNPHVEDVTVLGEAPRADELARALAGMSRAGGA